MNNQVEIKKQQRKVLFAAAGVCFLSGMLYMWSILSKSLVDDLGWTSSQASLPYTVYTLAFVTSMVIFGKVQDTKGPRLVVTVGSILMGLGLIIAGIFTTPTMVVMGVGVITGGGIGMITAGSTPPVIKWYPPEKKGLVTGIVVAGTGFSAIFYSPLGSYLLTSVGIHKTFIIIGVFSLIASVILSQNLRNPDRDLYAKPATDESPSQKNYTWQEMLKDSDAYKLWLMFAFASSAGLMIISHASTIAVVQAGWQGGFVLVIILSLFNTLGRFSGGVFSDKIGRINFLRIALGVQLINMIMFKTYTSQITMILGAAIAGYCYGSNFSVFPSAVADMYGTKNYGINYGIVFTGWGVGGIIGPMVAARIYDARGNYVSAFKVAAILLIVSLGIPLLFGRGKAKEEEIEVEKMVV